MIDEPPEPDGRDDAADDIGMPRWVKISGAIFILFVLAIVVMHLTGRGFHGH